MPFILKMLSTLKKINELENVIVIHDGLRETADLDEKNQHEKTRYDLLEYARTENKFDVVTYKTNIGLTRHFFRIYADLGENTSKIIFLEEDKLPTKNGIDFLTKQSINIDPKNQLDTMPLTDRHTLELTELATLQTRNGNFILGPELFNTAREIYFGANKFNHEFEYNLNKYLNLLANNRIGLKLAKNKIKRMYEWGLRSVDRPDGLLDYALMVLGGVKITPGSAQSIDISGLSTLGKNVNLQHKYTERVCDGEQILYNQKILCKSCEIIGVESRVSLSIRGQILNSMQYRIRKIDHFNRAKEM